MPFSAAVPGFDGIGNALTIAQTGESQANRRAKNQATEELLQTQEERVKKKNAVNSLTTQTAGMKQEENSAVMAEGLHTKTAVAKQEESLQSSENNLQVFKRHEDFYNLENITNQESWTAARIAMQQDGRAEEYIDSVLGPASQGYAPEFIKQSQVRIGKTVQSRQARDLQGDKIAADLAIAESTNQAKIQAAYIAAKAGKDLRVKPEFKEAPGNGAEGYVADILAFAQQNPELMDVKAGALKLWQTDPNLVRGHAESVSERIEVLYQGAQSRYIAAWNATNGNPPQEMHPDILRPALKMQAMLEVLGKPPPSTPLNPTGNADYLQSGDPDPVVQNYSHQIERELMSGNGDLITLWKTNYSGLTFQQFRIAYLEMWKQRVNRHESTGN